MRTILGTHVPPAWRRSGPSGERRPRRVTGRLAALVAAMAGVLTAAVVFAGPAGAFVVPPPNDPPPGGPVEWSLVSNVTGQCVAPAPGTQFELATAPCNGSASQKYQTLYFTGYAQLRNVATQDCLWSLDYVSLAPCDYGGTRWTPVPGPNGLVQWRSQSDGLCLGIPLATNPYPFLQDRSCADATTYWHFGLGVVLYG